MNKIQKMKTISLVITGFSVLALLVATVFVVLIGGKETEAANNEVVESNELNKPNLLSRLDIEEPPDYGQLSMVNFKQIDTAYLGSVALSSEGGVWTWGFNGNGQLGIDETPTAKPYAGGMVRVPSLENIKQVEAGYHYYGALSDDGDVYLWGQNHFGQIAKTGGDYNTNSFKAPQKLNRSAVGMDKVKKISLGFADDQNGVSVAIDESGKVWVWGRNHFGQHGQGNTTQTAAYNATPHVVPFPENIEIVDIATGAYHVLALDSNGDVWSWGFNDQGQLGVGSISTKTSPVKVSTSTGMGKVVQIDSFYRTSLALDENGDIWQWGGYATSWDGKAANANKRQPKKVEIKQSEIDEIGYIPVPQSIAGGEWTSSFIDQYGRIWSWGGNVYYGLGLVSSPYLGDNVGMPPRNIFEPAAIQSPKIIGDGDTSKFKPGIAPYPALNTFQNKYSYGSGDSLHPTIYDAKYREDDFFPFKLDNGTLPEFPNLIPTFPESNPQYKEISKPTETWATLGLKQFPKIKSLSGARSGTAAIDTNGNIYRWAYDGSGTIAWGWDTDDKYDWNASWGGNNTTRRGGLYNKYTYEPMFMRGAPNIDNISIRLDKPSKKIYKKDAGESGDNESDTITAKFKIPQGRYDAQMMFDIFTELQEIRYVVMPYDPSHPKFGTTYPTKDEFDQEFEAAPNESKGDLLTEGPIKSDYTQDLEVEKTLKVTDNSVVWMMIKDVASNGIRTTYTSARYAADNFYTKLSIDHEGVEEGKPTNQHYSNNTENISKVTDDGIDKLIGFPLDKSGKVIGTPTTPPTFGYDKVKVSKLSNEQLEELEANFSKYWLWVTPQAESKTYTLNGEDKNNNDDKTKPNGELSVTDKYTHTFFYKKNPKGFVTLHYIGVDVEGNKIDAFSMDSEEVKKGVELKRTPKDLSSHQLTAKEFKLTDGRPPTNFPVNVDNMTGLNKEGNLVFTVPLDDNEGTDKTIVILYAPPFGKLHVRQVVVDKKPKVDLPRQGYMTLTPAKPDLVWTFGDTTSNIFTVSQLVTDKAEYSEYKLAFKKGYVGYGLTYVSPQYYEYIGYKMDSDNGDYDEHNVNINPEINLDFTNNNQYWVSVYIKPQTDSPNNYTWGVALNDFGIIQIK